MEISVIATTRQLGELEVKGTYLDDLYVLGGRMAGVCYMPDNYFDSKIQNIETAKKRAEGCYKSGHHSPFDHGYMTLEITGIPKILAMILNSTEFYTTSEKSARYTVMKPEDPREEALYNKWREKFTKLIKNHMIECGKNATDKEIDKLAMENARYMISVFTPTTMCYTTSLRQFNYLIQWLKKLICDIGSVYDNPFYHKLYPYVIELQRRLMDIFGLKIIDNKDNGFQFLSAEPIMAPVHRTEIQTIGDVYSLNYRVSFAALAQLQRHRTIHYEMYFDPKYTYVYIPPIIPPALESEWCDDIISISENYPQGLLVAVNESGRFYDFVLKSKERLCSRAQLEIFYNTKDTMQLFIDNKNKLSNKSIKILNKCTKDGAVIPRCMFEDFKCTEECLMGPKYCLNLNRKI